MICEIYLARLSELGPAHVRLLNQAEQVRSRHFSQPADRDRFVLGAALLRLAAARRLAVPAAAVRVDRRCSHCREQHGRPMLTGSTVHASVAHSADRVTVALTSAGPVGVDIEAVTARAYARLLAVVCTAAEQDQVRCAANFYCYWTRKEAVLKATGDGLRRPMTDLTVSAPSAGAALLALRPGPAPACQLADVPAGPGYQAAAAVLTTEPVRFVVRGAAGLADAKLK